MSLKLLPSLFVRAVGVALLLAANLSAELRAAEAALVFQSDFGLKDGAVSAMKGVAFGVSPALKQFDITHEIPPYNVWEAAFRLKQTAAYWPSNTVFVSVVDPGVGTERRSVVMRAKTGHLFVTPDNGTLTFIAETLGVAELREIDTARQRLKDSEASYTFHGRDVFAYVGAKLATGKLKFADVGPRLTNGIVAIPYTKAAANDGALFGTIPVLDVQYGNVWSNIEKPLFDTLGAKIGDRFSFRILKDGKLVHSGETPYVATFGGVKTGEPLLFLNSLLEVSLALNTDSFAKKFGISAGPEWSLEIRRIGK